MKAAILGLALLAIGCTNESGTRRALIGAGYSNIVVTGYEMWSCAKGDGTCTGFEATGPTGVRVKGVVGCGWFFKGCTIRTE